MDDGSVSADFTGSAQRLEIGFEVAPSGGALGLVAAEDAHCAYVTLVGYVPSIEDVGGQDAVALITFTGVLQVVFGYPNEEAFWRDPRGLHHGLWEIHGSRWADDVRDYNRSTFGVDMPFYGDHRHLFVGSKDVSAQFLCEGVAVATFPGARWSDVHAESVRRLRA